MSAKAMFSTDIVRSDAFMTMPKSAQLLYFHFGMEADNDGFIGNPHTLIRTCGCAKSDFMCLVEKRFILVFKSGICVVKHHWMNNNKRSDRYKGTKYQDELVQLTIKDNGAYTEKNKPSTSDGRNIEPSFGYESGKKPATTQHESGKKRYTNSCPNITEHNRTELKYSCSNPAEFERFWFIYPRKQKKQDALKAWGQTAKGRPQIDIVLRAVEKAKQSLQWQKDGGQFIPLPASWLRGGCWEDEMEIGSEVRTSWFCATLKRDLDKHKAGDVLKVAMEGDEGMCRALTASGEQGLNFTEWFEASDV